MNALQQELGPRGFALVAINSNDVERSPDDSFEAMEARAREQGFAFDYLHDESQEIAPRARRRAHAGGLPLRRRAQARLPRRDRRLAQRRRRHAALPAGRGRGRARGRVAAGRRHDAGRLHRQVARLSGYARRAASASRLSAAERGAGARLDEPPRAEVVAGRPARVADHDAEAGRHRRTRRAPGRGSCSQASPPAASSASQNAQNVTHDPGRRHDVGARRRLEARARRAGTRPRAP